MNNVSLDKLTFEGFKNYANDNSLSEYERIGFPNSMRKGYETVICKDIYAKVLPSQKDNYRLLDIGCGASPLTDAIISLFIRDKANMFLIDSEEMLAKISDSGNITKVPGFFPDLPDFIERNIGEFDVIILYSVLQHIILQQSVFSFIDAAVELLAPGGNMLIGDIPNYSKRKRFFSSDRGIACHKDYTGTDNLPDIRFNVLEKDRIDDSLVFSILMRYRLAGFDTYILPQAEELPFSSRREDILICRP